MIAIDSGNQSLATLLLKLNASLDLQDNRGNTPLHHAVMNASSGMVELLLENRAPVNRKNRQGMSPLHCAVERGNLATVQALASVTDTTLRNARGETPLMQAERMGNKTIYKTLLKMSIK